MKTGKKEKKISLKKIAIAHFATENLIKVNGGADVPPTAYSPPCPVKTSDSEIVSVCIEYCF